MEFNFNMRGRRSIRLQGHDYSSPGDYFVTICTLKMECVLGEIIAGKIMLSPAGKIVSREWCHTATIRPEVELGPFVVMPNHLHGIMTIRSRRGDPAGRPESDFPKSRASQRDAPTEKSTIASNTTRSAPTLEPGTIGAIFGQFKSISTKKIRATDLIGFHWQRNYYEHIIRSRLELKQISNYILENPANWSEDPDNPNNFQTT